MWTVKSESWMTVKAASREGMMMKVRFFPAEITMGRGRPAAAARTTVDAG
jgi:hypothetical protein